jgi:hypothetical protein
MKNYIYDLIKYIIVVAVGSALSGTPPHRSLRAGLPHRAPQLDRTCIPLIWTGAHGDWCR